MKFINSFLILLVVSFLFPGCNKDDELLFNEVHLIGMWTTTGSNLDLRINDTPILQWYQEELGLSGSEVEDFVDGLIESFSRELSGSIEYYTDYTYLSNFGSLPAGTGTWELTNNNRTLTITNNGNFQSTEMDILTLNSTTLIVSFERTDSEDLDNDGIEEDLTLKIELTFEK